MLSLRRLPRPPSCGGTRGASLCVVVPRHAPFSARPRLAFFSLPSCQ
jgi:hypothetical protein